MARTDLPTDSHTQLNCHKRSCHNPCLLAQEACWDLGKEKKPEEWHRRHHPKRIPRNAAKMQIHCNLLQGGTPARFPTYNDQSLEGGSILVCVHLDSNKTPRWLQSEHRTGPPLQSRQELSRSFLRAIHREAERLKQVCGGGRSEMCYRPQLLHTRPPFC